MEDVFKQNLLDLRSSFAPRTFREALLGQGSWVNKATPLIHSQGSDVLEKRKIAQSLENFAEKKVGGSGTLKVDGLEIKLKPKDFKSSLDPKLSELLLSSKLKNKIRILFVTEATRSWQEIVGEQRVGFINELLPFFPMKTAEFFERMVQAMKLSELEILMYPMEEGTRDLSSEVFELAAYFSPEIIITLGAKSTQKILNTSDRLSVIHGQFINREIPNLGNFQVVPLFHPAVLETNQNMKKTAWADMQKIMKSLKILQ